MSDIIVMIKKIIAKILVGVEYACSTDLKKYSKSAWYENKIPEVEPVEIFTAANLLEPTQSDWKTYNRIEYSGVSIVSMIKIVMFESLNGYHHQQARKAMVCTEHYRPFKYPYSMNMVYTFKFMRHILKLLNKKKKGVVAGSAALLGNRVYDNTNYYHFWVDVISDIWYLKNNIPASEFPDYYLVPFAGLDWQWDILNTCGLSENQVIPYDRYDFISIEKLIIPIRDKGVANLPSWLSRAIHEMSSWSPKGEKKERLIFISRADANRRRVVNEAVIRERLLNEGFEVHTLVGLSLREQQYLFASASIICAPHGAALTNLVWCRPGAIVIDFLSENHLPPCFKELAEQNGVIYYPYICQQVEGKEEGLRGDIYISDQQVDSVLNVVVQHASRSDNILED
ncbi:MAG TPA: glycosyltransferase family 61 protein [Halomonas sp.]|nr:glycosyltransferase family 61 protein [Halomonas sp.]